jgi:hypothetical protein
LLRVWHVCMALKPVRPKLAHRGRLAVQSLRPLATV